MRQILLPLALAAATQAQLVTFAAGSPAKAADVNGNFAYLAARLDSLTKALASKDTVIASLKASSSWGDSLKELGKRLDAGIPKGTIAAFMTVPGTDGYLPNSDQTWMLAAGQKSVHGFDSLPDLRGQFLRGLNVGLNDSTRDPDVDRMPGSKQVDAFQGHRHGPGNIANFTEAFGSGSYQANYLRIQKTALDIQNSIVGVPVTDGVNGTPRTAMETRPKNVAVYWYIKVK